MAMTSNGQSRLLPALPTAAYFRLTTRLSRKIVILFLHSLRVIVCQRSTLFGDFVTAGGLMYYGTDLVTHFRRAASYVDRVLRGTKPADLPVEAPTKYETVLNLKTAKTL